MPISDRQMLYSLNRTPFVDSAELAVILGEAHATVRVLLLWTRIRPSFGSAPRPSGTRMAFSTSDSMAPAVGRSDVPPVLRLPGATPR